MRKLERAYQSPEIQEILGNAHPSKSPEEVGAENWKGQRVMDLSGNSTPRLRPQQQYEINRAWDLSAVTDEKGRINGQGRKAIAAMPYGSSTVGAAGCESIAVYNLLRDLGRNVSFPDVIRTADENHCFFFEGDLGIIPGGTKRLLRAYGIDYQEVNKNLLQSWADHGYMSDREDYIAIIWNQWPEAGKPGKPNLLDGIHTFLLVYDEKGKEIGDTGEIGNWLVYNRSNFSQEEIPYKDLTDILGENGRYWKILRIMGGSERNE